MPERATTRPATALDAASGAAPSDRARLVLATCPSRPARCISPKRVHAAGVASPRAGRGGPCRLRSGGTRGAGERPRTVRRRDCRARTTHSSGRSPTRGSSAASATRTRTRSCIARGCRHLAHSRRDSTPRTIERLYAAARRWSTEWTDRLRGGRERRFRRRSPRFARGWRCMAGSASRVRCVGRPVQRIRYAANETNYCARCQTGGRLLADRALSRLLTQTGRGRSTKRTDATGVRRLRPASPTASRSIACAAHGRRLGAPRARPGGARRLPHIPVERFTLPNGLTVLLSPDTTAPIVSVTIWYHVGSKNEQRGRTGFAHLFEHVMFQGSEHVAKGEHIKTDRGRRRTMNGSTQQRSHRTTTRPCPEQLPRDRALARIGSHGVPPARADAGEARQPARRREERAALAGRQPAVRQRGRGAGRRLVPRPNPYSWPVIGSMADLSAASLDDVKAFFRTLLRPRERDALDLRGHRRGPRSRSWWSGTSAPIPRGPEIERPTVDDRRR